MGEFRAQPISSMAIIFDDYNTYGCPVCLSGEKKGSTLIQTGGASLFACANCHVAYLVVNGDKIPQTLTKNEYQLAPHPLA
jgi:hypothetical protein